jgi:hypothetical protein
MMTDTAERFFEKVDPSGDCWEYLVAPIPERYVIDHLCRNTLCVNPDHLRAVTDRVNVLAGFGVVAMQARQTHCKRGHALVGENVIVRANRRWCRECKRERDRKDKRRRRAADREEQT